MQKGRPKKLSGRGTSAGKVWSGIFHVKLGISKSRSRGERLNGLGPLRRSKLSDVGWGCDYSVKTLEVAGLQA